MMLIDNLIVQLDRGLRTVFGVHAAPGRASPASGVDEVELSEAERWEVVGLMRVNHAGEVAAQALYHGQALTARRADVREALERAASEENDHLTWCRDRLTELGGRPSVLDPLWYAGSFAIGAAAGLLGDRFNLSFLAETERQVVAHLDAHLERLPEGDDRSRSILTTMRSDEASHATCALKKGGKAMPEIVREGMHLASRVMTRTAYWL
jgi:ubiquinone biosynthesis monooxygenase Coq7